MAGYNNDHRQRREYEFQPRGWYSGIDKTTGYIEPKVNGMVSPGQRAFFRSRIDSLL